MLSPSDCFLTVDSLRTRYWQVGDSGTPVVCIHGLGGSIEGFLPVLERLATCHRVYALDLPGHGLTDKPEGFSYLMPHLAHFVDEFMQRMEIQRAHIIGHSMGGAVALSLVIEFPERVDHLVLMDSAGLGREASLIFRLPALPWIGEYLTRPKPPKREDQKAFVYDISALDERAMQVDYEHSCLPGAQQALLKIMRANVNILGQKVETVAPITHGLPGIHSPVLIIWGRDDPIVPVEHAEAAARAIPGARLHILEQCKHLPMVEKTDEVNRLIAEFLHEKEKNGSVNSL